MNPMRLSYNILEYNLSTKSGILLCGCVGPMWGEPYCPCTMECEKLERSDTYKEYHSAEKVQERLQRLEAYFKDST